MILHYQELFLSAMMQTLWHLDIVGNPLGLINNISMGVKDLVEKPIFVSIINFI